MPCFYPLSRKLNPHDSRSYIWRRHGGERSAEYALDRRTGHSQVEAI